MTTQSKVPEYHASIISKFPANEWVKPYNSSTSNDHQVFSDLYEWGLVERRIEEHYKGKTLIGTSFYFKYNK